MHSSRERFLDLRWYRSIPSTGQDKDLFTIQIDLYRSGLEVYLPHYLLKQRQKWIEYLLVSKVHFNIKCIRGMGSQDQVPGLPPLRECTSDCAPDWCSFNSPGSTLYIHFFQRPISDNTGRQEASFPNIVIHVVNICWFWYRHLKETPHHIEKKAKCTDPSAYDPKGWWEIRGKSVFSILYLSSPHSPQIDEFIFKCPPLLIILSEA